MRWLINVQKCCKIGICFAPKRGLWMNDSAGKKSNQHECQIKTENLCFALLCFSCSINFISKMIPKSSPCKLCHGNNMHLVVVYLNNCAVIQTWWETFKKCLKHSKILTQCFNVHLKKRQLRWNQTIMPWMMIDVMNLISLAVVGYENQIWYPFEICSTKTIFFSKYDQSNWTKTLYLPKNSQPHW